MVLHLLSTAVMVRLGRVEGNLMTNLRPASRKLERRALGILMTLGGASEERARRALDECRGSVQRRARARAARGRCQVVEPLSNRDRNRDPGSE